MKNSNYKKAFSEVIKQFTGLKKAEAFDIISKLETLIFYAPDPICFKNQDVTKPDLSRYEIDIDPFQFTILPNGNLCELIGCSHLFHIYKEHKRMVPDWAIFRNYYFKSKYNPLELNKLSNKNLLQIFKNTPEEIIIHKFLANNKVTTKDGHSAAKLSILNI